MGAKDKGRRWKTRRHLTYEQRKAAARNLGAYAKRGGPGRPRGSYGKSRLLDLACSGDVDAWSRLFDSLPPWVQEKPDPDGEGEAG